MGGSRRRGVYVAAAEQSLYPNNPETNYVIHPSFIRHFYGVIILYAYWLIDF